MNFFGDSMKQVSVRNVEKNQMITDERSALPSKPVELRDATFFETVKKSKLMVVDFWAPWCAQCRMVSPMLERLAKEYSGMVTFGKLSVDKNH
ncbi:MAG TPA: thioredoxin domain-containing protein [Nitrososphaerales archaeon]|nr:thioredoxin domain-containing protein [Nitrososphaerales archaeon]